jgi:radical SAM-linked protein
MRLRLTFTKTGSLKYTGHLNLHRTLERTFRRAGLPLAYSQGFNPQPRMNLAEALPLGITSECEVMDVWLETQIDLEQGKKDLDRAAPPGMQILTMREVDEKSPPLQTQVVAAEYRVTVSGGTPNTVAVDLDSRARDLLSQSTLMRERRGKHYDLRPLIESLSVEENVLVMKLSARDGATGRPDEVLKALGMEGSNVHRSRLFFVP